jgi:hypothetical protein
MVWKPGQTGNPNGRPRKYTQPPPGVNPRDFYCLAAYRDEYRNVAEAHGLEDPVLFQHKLLQDDTLPVGLRATVAAAIAPYYRPKLGLQTPPRMIEMHLDVPNFQTVEEAEAFLIKITALVGSGDLSLSTALDLSTLVRNWISAKHQAAELEIKRLNADVSDQPQIIKIEGGLPPLPGTDIIGPTGSQELTSPDGLNGNARVINGSVNEPLPVQANPDDQANQK